MNADQLQTAAAQIPLTLKPADAEHLILYVDLLLKWNRAYNLTAVRDRDEMFVTHILDSLSIAAYIRGPKVLDVGTGAGLPGLVLAIVFPQIQFFLLDSNGKKTRFLNEAVRVLQLSNVTVHCSRVEDFSGSDGFDQITSRAFTALPRFAALCAGLLRPGGELLAMMGKLPESAAATREQLSELPIAFKLHDCPPLTVPGIDAPRHLSIIKHIEGTNR